MMDLAELRSFMQEHFTRTAFRLETLDVYEVLSDGSDFARYVAGEPEPTPERKQPWLDRLRSERDRGLYRSRVHILTPPLGPYLRYECEWGYRLNSEAGEDIRILDLSERPIPDVGDYANVDFWLLDDHQVVTMRYGPQGVFQGAVVEPTEGATGYRGARDSLWAAAEPFTTWWSRHPEYHRDTAGAA